MRVLHALYVSCVHWTAEVGSSVENDLDAFARGGVNLSECKE